MKEYFSHDYNTRDDQKIKRLMYTHSWVGYGLYWGLIESLYQNKGYMLLDYDSIAFDMRTDKILIDSIINSFDLFKIKENKFYSESVLRRLKERKNKSDKAKKSAEYRWGKVINEDANALRSHSDINAIKEKKSIVNNIIENQLKFKEEIKQFTQYDNEMLKAFYMYWSEPTRDKSKIRKDLEKTWDTSRRLLTWFNRSKNDKRN